MHKFLFTLLLLPLVCLAQDKKHVLFIAGSDSHGGCCHNHSSGTKILMDAINDSGLPVKATRVTGGWPEDPTVFDGVDAVIIYCDGGGRHVVMKHLDAFDKIMDKGVGLGCIHYGVEVPKGKSGDLFKKWIGGYFETNWSVNPHWVANLEVHDSHPVANGVNDFSLNDEWYFHMRFRDDMKGVTPIFSAVAPDATMKRRDGAHSGNPHVRASVAAKDAQHLYWVAERKNEGKGFGITGGHFHKNWANDDFRRGVLNGIVWIANAEVPEAGVKSKTPETPDDGAKPKAGPKPKPKKLSGAKAAWSSKVISKATKGHAVPVDVELKKAKSVWLVADDGGDGFGCDWVAWVNPRFETPKGEVRLTDLKWKNASTGYGQVRINKNCGGAPIKVDGRAIDNGIGAHAISIIEYAVPAGATRFKAEAALDEGGTKQDCGSTVSFSVHTKKPTFAAVKAKSVGGVDASEALATMETGEGLSAELFASEPMTLSISDMDIDHKGRAWVCEVVNYRGNNGKRPGGDRILCLEDTNGDGKADKSTTFYQGRDIDSALGICVLGNKVIVSVAPNVFVFTDEDGDLKADKKETLFSKVGRPQHDHSTHAFVFGPDGKLYWNVGNTGMAVHDKDGKIVVDKAGNEVRDNRKPYIGGMVFRCDMDGGNFETLGHNFRNNYEVAVDSFGTLWQSDNDDDGNKGVRINYVMEFGNFGYKDEKTGAAWKTKRTGQGDTNQLRHWHQNDPGVVPNLINTGSGSPCGIMVYEGQLLPKTYQNQMLHAEAGHNIARVYPVKADGAGYSGTMETLLKSADRFYRPSDVCAAPDGSVFVADWYDPGVGGHGMRDLDRGRLFRVVPSGHKGYKSPSFDFGSVDGAIVALKNANLDARYLGWTALHGMGDSAVPALKEMAKDNNPRYRARALWLLSKMVGQDAVDMAASDKDPDLRIAAVRMARQLGTPLAIVERLKDDSNAGVRRACAIALRGQADGAKHWAHLASKHDGKDRWYLEALGIGAHGNDDAFLQAWLDHVGDHAVDGWNTAGGRDILWRSRSAKAPAYLAKIVKSIPADQHARYMRAFDFHTGPEKDKALQAILGL